jgi:hypothetical protein
VAPLGGPFAPSSPTSSAAAEAEAATAAADESKPSLRTDIEVRAHGPCVPRSGVPPAR